MTVHTQLQVHLSLPTPRYNYARANFQAITDDLHEHLHLNAATLPPVFDAVNNALNLLLINLRFFNNRSSLVCDLINDNSIDISVIAEIWHTLGADVALCSAAPTGYSIFDAPWPIQHGNIGVNHGGLAVFHGPSLSARLIHLPLKPTT